MELKRLQVPCGEISAENLPRNMKSMLKFVRLLKCFKVIFLLDNYRITKGKGKGRP